VRFQNQRQQLQAHGNMKTPEVMDIKILSQNIANNPKDFPAEHIEELFIKYASQFQQPKKETTENEIIFYNLIPEKGDLIPIIQNWLAYKRQKRETYKPIGLKTLIKKFNQFEGSYSELESIVENSIMNNYSGIIWKLKTAVNGKPEKRSTESAAHSFITE